MIVSLGIGIEIIDAISEKELRFCQFNVSRFFVFANCGHRTLAKSQFLFECFCYIIRKKNTVIKIFSCKHHLKYCNFLCHEQQIFLATS